MDTGAGPPSRGPGDGAAVPQQRRSGGGHHLAGSALALVFLGGCVGVAVREGMSLGIPDRDGVPVVIPVVNLVAAFALGYLYEAVARVTPGTPTAGHLKLLLGTGFCGGLSTYSSLATDTAKLLVEDRPGTAAGYALATLVLGALATLAGIALGGRLHVREPDGHELRRIEGHAREARP